MWATALSELPSLLVLWPRFKQLGLLRLERELLAVGFYLGGLGLAWVVQRLVGLG